MTPQYILEHDSKPAHCFSAHQIGKGYVNNGNDPTTRDEYNKQLARARESQIENMGYANEYAEPGYTNPAKGILFADWNCFSRKVSDVLERAGYDIEWEDEWTTCEDCGKAVRTSGNSYDWQPYYVDQHGIVCLDCVDWTDYLESIEDNACVACMARCNPADYGYELVSQPREFENGFHAGMNDNPKDILERLQAQGKRHLVFRIDETSQFYITFEVWQKIAESDDDEQEEE